eukprot:scaffold73033_cov27-Phaeocystis_antarctica.AAC.1
MGWPSCWWWRWPCGGGWAGRGWWRWSGCGGYALLLLRGRRQLRRPRRVDVRRWAVRGARRAAGGRRRVGRGGEAGGEA